MTGPGNLYGSAPVASAPRRGGGGGGGSNRNRNRNQGGGGGAGGGNNKPPSSPLYGGDQGEALTNQDPEQYIQDLLGQLGVLDSSGSQYGTWRNSNMAATLLSGYRQALDNDQSINPADYFKNTYGAGWTDAGGKKHKGNSVFNAGTLSSITGPSSDQYQDYLSTNDPGNFLLGKFGQAGLTVPGGGNADFDRYLTNVYAPKVQANLDAAQAAGAVSTDGNLVSIPGAAGGSGSTLPFGSSGDFGGDPMNRRAWLHDQGLHRLGQMNANSRHNAKGQYQDYLSGFGNGGGGGATDPATSGAPSTVPITLNDFLATQNLDQARQMYAFRSNAERQPSPLQLAGRYSWWG